MLNYMINKTEVEEFGFTGTTKDLYSDVSMLIGMVYSVLDDEHAEDFKRSLIGLVQNDMFWSMAKMLDMKSQGLVSGTYPMVDGKVVFGDADNKKAF